MKSTIKNQLMFLHLLCLSTIAFSQNPIYFDKINFGNHAIGFKDTVLVKNEESYSFLDYEGGKPFFVNIWYPGEAETDKPWMTYKDYWDFNAPKEMDSLKMALQGSYKDIFKEYAVCSSTLNWRIHSYNSKQKKLNETLLNMNVNAKRNLEIESGKFPCIIYHHGAWASNEDNSLFCEFMASHGYVVISSNYEWPSHDFGYDESVKDVAFVTDFASKLPMVDINQLIYAGHSLGAQTGFFVNANSRNRYKVFVSFDTTIEGKSLSYTKKKFPLMDSLFTHHADQLTTPMILFSTVQIYYDRLGRPKKQNPSPNFELFRTLHQTKMEFITAISPLEHNNFTSQGIMRSFFTNEVKQKDKKEIAKQCGTYLSLLNITKDLLSNYLIIKNQDVNLMYRETFNFEVVND